MLIIHHRDRMRPSARRVLLLVFAFIALLSAPSVSIVAQQPKAPAAQSAKRLFWKATIGNGVAYLLGSVHLGTKAMFPLPPEIETAYNASDSLVVEVNLNSIDQSKLLTLVREKGMYAGDDTIFNHIDKPTADSLRAFGTKYGMPAISLQKMKPWMVALLVSVLPMQAAGFDANLGIDKYFLDKAKDKKPVEQLESADAQVKLLSDVSDADQAKYLTETLKQTSKSQEDSDKLQRFWLQGDAGGLSGFMKSDATEPKELQHKLIDDRNRTMTDSILTMLKSGKHPFVVVGAAHYVGDAGIVALLKKSGASVEQVPVTSAAAAPAPKP